MIGWLLFYFIFLLNDLIFNTENFCKKQDTEKNKEKSIFVY